MNEYGVNAGKVVLAGLLGVILTVAAVMALQVLYYRHLGQIQAAEQLDQSSPKLEKAIAEQQQRLTQPGPVGDDLGTVVLPIDRAMAAVVADLSRPEEEENPDDP